MKMVMPPNSSIQSIGSSAMEGGVTAVSAGGPCPHVDVSLRQRGCRADIIWVRYPYRMLFQVVKKKMSQFRGPLASGGDMPNTRRRPGSENALKAKRHRLTRALPMWESVPEGRGVTTWQPAPILWWAWCETALFELF